MSRKVVTRLGAAITVLKENQATGADRKPNA